MSNSLTQQAFTTPIVARHLADLQVVSDPQPNTGKRKHNNETGEGLPAIIPAGEEQFTSILTDLENPFAATSQNTSVQKNSGLAIGAAEPVLSNSTLYSHTTIISGSGEREAADIKQGSKSATAFAGITLFSENKNTNATPSAIAPNPSGNIQAPDNTVVPNPAPKSADHMFFGPEASNTTNTPPSTFLSRQPPHPPPTLSLSKTDIDAQLEIGKPGRNQTATNTVTPIQSATLSIPETSPVLQVPGSQGVTAKQSQLIITQIGEALVEQSTNKASATNDKTVNTLKPVLVQLSPAELGRVQIQFNFNANERITANIIAENPETGALLKQKSDLLVTQLRLGGFANIDLSFEAKNENNFSNPGSDSSKNQHTGIEPYVSGSTFEDETHSEQQKTGQEPHIARTHAHIITDRLDITL